MQPLDARRAGLHAIAACAIVAALSACAVLPEADDVNDWIGARFQYDMARALLLSESQRQRNARLAITAPAAFFDTPHGVCVDLSRFAVETLRALDPTPMPVYLMIEFDPLMIQGHIAGPYASVQDSIDDCARYRGRRIVSFKLLETCERRMRTLSVRRDRVEGP